MSSSANPLEPLSPREREVLLLFLEGLRLKEIAAQLDISINSVNGYKRNVLRKLQLTSDVHLVIFCLRHGVIPLHRAA